MNNIVPIYIFHNFGFIRYFKRYLVVNNVTSGPTHGSQCR